MSNSKKTYLFGQVKISTFEELMSHYHTPLESYPVYALIPAGPDTDQNTAIEGNVTEATFADPK